MAVNAGEPVRRQRPKKRQQTVAFQYDDADRQTKVTYTSGMSVSTTYTDAGEVKSLKYAKADRSLIAQGGYTYDLAGRRIGVSGDLANFVSTQGSDISDASFNAANQLLTWNGKSFSYDANGNMPSDGSTTYQWDERDQLVGITSTTTNASFKYDSDGRRIARTLGPTTTAYNFDGDNFIQELDAVGRTGNITANLLTGGIDQHFMRQTTVNGQPSLSWVMSEANNSTVVQTDGSGNVQKAFQYTPYGGPAATTGTSTDSQRYTGREDDGTGLYYYRARYYRPDCMRFISEDPIGWASGQVNNYAYVGGNPVSRTDPSGLLFGGVVNAGECYGASAAQYWADQQVATGNPLYAIPGVLASLWTPATSDYTVAVLSLGYSAANLAKVLPNFAERAGNPFWYEMGQKTIPTAVYDLVKHLPAAERGKAIVANMGWLKALLPSSGPWSTTLAAGPTPGGLLGVTVVGGRRGGSWWR